MTLALGWLYFLLYFSEKEFQVRLFNPKLINVILEHEQKFSKIAVLETRINQMDQEAQALIRLIKESLRDTKSL